MVRVRGDSGKTVSFTPAKTENFEATVRLCASSARPSGWPLHARYAIRLDVFLAHERGDLDNFLKSVGDAANGILWHDDSARYVRDAELHVERDLAHPRIEVQVVARPVPCKLSGCGRRETFYPDDKGRCEDCTAKATARPAGARRS